MKPLTKPTKSVKQALMTTTFRDFSGGWNVLDDDLNLEPKYAVKMYNCFRASDGTVSVRYGTSYHANVRSVLSSLTAYVINMQFFNNYFIAVCSNGEIVRVQADGAVEKIWSTAIASLLPGAPAGWSATDFASFAQFNGKLVICNGIDKPLQINQAFVVTYLQDAGTGSNLNTPICKYVISANRFIVMAGDPVNPSRIHIGAKDTIGTFYGDPAPNDATFIDVGSVLGQGTIIRGIAAFRGKIIVTFVEGTIIGQLDIYDATGNHTPKFDDPVEQYGAVSHRSLLSYGDDLLMTDLVGVPSLKRTVFTGTIRPERVSDLIDPEMAAMLNSLSFLTLENRVFSVYNQRDGQFMFFVPNNDVLATTTETTCFVFNYRSTINVVGWARFDGWNFTCGARSLAGSVFFGDQEGNIWLYGNRDTPSYSDFVNESTGIVGVPINFVWEWPWLDFKKRTNTKTSKYLTMDTRGTAEFNAEMYTDLDVATPTLSMGMTGGDSAGFGAGPQPFGGGRRTSYQRLWAWPAKFTASKMKFSGAVTEELRFVSVSLQYQEGKIYR